MLHNYNSLKFFFLLLQFCCNKPSKHYYYECCDQLLRSLIIFNGSLFMKKTIILSIVALMFAFTNAIKADISLSGYVEFFAGSADQSLYKARGDHALDQAGLINGNYSRIDASYSTTLDSGIEVSGTYTADARDCATQANNSDGTAAGQQSGNCNVVDFNFMSFSGGFGTFSVGEMFDTGASMLSRLTASVPTGEPDGGLIAAFYTGDDTNSYGAANEINYASSALKAVYMSNVYSGFSFAVGYTPNAGENGQNNADGQPDAATSATWGSYNDVLSVHGKYAMEMDGIGLELVYGQQTGNAGTIVTTQYNDLDETSYSAKITYGNFAADYRKNDSGNSGYAKGVNTGNVEGTSICGLYTMGNTAVGACQVNSSQNDANNFTNDATTRTYSAEYQLGGGVALGIVYFDVEQTANSVERTDVTGLATKLSIGF